jgi:hypothetical protein
MTAASPVIDKTDWKLGNSLDDMMNNNIKISYGSNGVAWMAKNGDGIYYIPYKENATAKKVIDRPVAGKISLSGDTLIYTERFTSTTFKTYSLDLVKDEKKILSSGELNTGVIVELGN